MKKLIFAASFLSALMAAEIAGAHVRVTNHKQQGRIEQGVRHGQLTRNEARQLKMQQQRINSMKRMAKADGVITSRERTMIRNAEQRANLAIYNQKHDRDIRW